VAAERREGCASLVGGDGEEGCSATGEGGRAESTTTTKTMTNEEREREREREDL
jgi:hypothetical protein